MPNRAISGTEFLNLKNLCLLHGQVFVMSFFDEISLETNTLGASFGPIQIGFVLFSGGKCLTVVLTSPYVFSILSII